MTPKEKEDLVDLLNAHSRQLLAAIAINGPMPPWLREHHEGAIKAREQKFMSEPDEIAT